MQAGEIETEGMCLVDQTTTRAIFERLLTERVDPAALMANIEVESIVHSLDLTPRSQLSRSASASTLA